MSHIAEIKGRLQSAAENFQQVKTTHTHSANTAAELQSLLDRMDSIDASGSGDRRAQIAQLRAALFKCMNDIDELRGNMAELYRKSIGDKKDWFESLSPAEQQSQEPNTFECKQNYETVAKVGDMLIEINSSLLDESGELEHSRLSKIKPEPLNDEVPPYHFGSDDTPAPPRSPWS